ncbi:MAG: hypothetical protein JWN18_197 [Parcubacteria group bacterium]|nr:hypothetical protein [Parcubacteria group bacterium]
MSDPHIKKIIFVITKSNWGGAQRYVYDLATSLPTRTFEVSVAFGQSGRLAEELTKASVATFPILSLQRDVSVVADLKSLFELTRLFKQESPDVVHLNSSKAAGVGALAARLAGVPRIIFTAHGWPFAEKRSMLWRTFAYLGSWATALLSHVVIVVSKNDLNVGRGLPFSAYKMHLVYNGIDPHIPFASGAVIRNAFPAGAHITGTIGELTHNKNQISLIEQARSNPSMFVAIVGEGEERAALEAAIAEYQLRDRVKLFGFMPAIEVMKGFDEFALPSLKEGLPYVLLEAKVAGLSIDANHVGGVGEILNTKDMSAFSLEKMVANTISLY